MLPIFPDEKRTVCTKDSSSCAVPSAHHSSESSALGSLGRLPFFQFEKLKLIKTNWLFRKNDEKRKELFGRCETPPSPPAPDLVGIENSKQLFSPLLALTTQKIAIHSTEIISAVCVTFFGS